MKLEYKIIDSKYENVKQVLKIEFGISDRLLLRLKNNKKIFVNDNIAFVNDKVKLSDIISVLIDFEEDNSNIVPTKMDLKIVYEDDFMLILNKPAGIAIHPSYMHFDTSLSNGVKYYFDSINLKKKIRPINRLDKDTSGLVIFAKNEYIQECLVNQMKNKLFKKEYLAILNGTLEKNKGTINAPIARENDSIIKRCVRDNGDTSITHYEVIKNLDNICLVRFMLETGRTHQIRVHSAYIGHPIVGDTLYGVSSNLISRQALHSYKLEFFHPISKEKMCFEIELPDDMKLLLKKEIDKS